MCNLIFLPLRGEMRSDVLIAIGTDEYQENRRTEFVIIRMQIDFYKKKR